MLILDGSICSPYEIFLLLILSNLVTDHRPGTLFKKFLCSLEPKPPSSVIEYNFTKILGKAIWDKIRNNIANSLVY